MNPRDFKTPNYGMGNFSDLFTNRQLTAMITFSDLVAEAQEKDTADAVAAGMVNDFVPLRKEGNGAQAYGEAIGIYLAFVLSKLVDRNSNICGWDNGIKYETIRNVFSRQAIAMSWDYAEANPFSSSSGCFDNCLNWVFRCVELFPATSKATAKQFDAQSDCGLRNVMVSTDASDIFGLTQKSA